MKNEFPERIDAVMRVRKLRPRQLVKRCEPEIPRRTMYNYISGKTEPTYTRIKHIAKVTNTPVVDLF